MSVEEGSPSAPSPVSLDNYLLEALRQLGGEIWLVPGARVAAAAIQLAKRDGVDFREALANSGNRFGDLARQVVLTCHLRLVERAGSDFLLGFEGATERSINHQQGTSLPVIRRDFYEAFSHFGRSNLYYLRDKDCISTHESAPPGAIPIPRLTADDVWSTREKFAERIKDPDKRLAVLSVAKNLKRSFKAFADLVHMHDLSGDWHLYQYEQIRGAITQWAESCNVLVRDEWFSQREPSTSTATTLRTSSSLATLLAQLTEGELARVMLPADLIQMALLRLEAKK